MDDLINYARDGYRLVIRQDGQKDKTIWAGLGNRSGLGSFATDLIYDRWKKSGERFTKKLEKLPAGTTVAVQEFRNVNRDRGRWVDTRVVKVGGK